MTALLVTGAGGQLGRALAGRGPAAGFTVTALDRAGLDIADAAQVAAAIARHRPDAVINAAAFTAVDAAESRPDEAFAVNRDGPARLAAACREAGIALVHVSTDYVFDGTKGTPWTEADPVHPLGVYGASKEAGERAVRAALETHLIVRTAWVWDVAGHNFVRTMLRLGAERDRLTVVDDQRGTPTAARDLADALLTATRTALAGNDGWGTYHFTGGGETTWFGFAREIFRLAAAAGRRVPVVEPIPSSAWPTPARRPADSRLDCHAFTRRFGVSPVPWTEALARDLPAMLD
ncbi:MAG: dTDP-4-dehydrorhamnose reductase [Caulobacter sp.]|nr:dTDP-4-dehydrorhamnose reductase [Caulobacter sp.]